MFELDHLVITARDLDEGSTFAQNLLGVPLESGGKHDAMGTHNRLLNLGDGVYLEVITTDPDTPAPNRPRWFGLDSEEVQDKLEQGPTLLHWVARAENTTLQDSDLFGRVLPMQRGDLNWLITVPEDGHLPGDGVLPTLIDWGSAPHPTTKLPERGLKLVKLRGFHPEPQKIESALKELGLEEVIEVHEAAGVRLEATIETPNGTLSL